MEIKSVKPLEGVEQKSIQEREAEALAEKEAQDKAAAEKAAKAKEKEEGGIKEDDVLSFISKKLGKDVKSFDDIVKEKEVVKEVVKEPELPEDVKKFWDFKKETGRGLQDFMRLQRDYDNTPEDQLLREYYSETKEGLDESDINHLLNKFSIDEDEDDDRIAEIKIAKKEEIAKARKYFNQSKEKYKAPLESSGFSLKGEDKTLFDQFKQYRESLDKQKEDIQRKSSIFSKKTEELFSNEFKGFEFDLGENKLTFSPASPEEIKKANSSPTNLFKKFLDEDGVIKDPKGYHKALSIASDPDKFAKFFFEQGKHFQKNGMLKDIKNIDMSSNKRHVSVPNTGIKVQAKNADQNYSGRLVIRK